MKAFIQNRLESGAYMLFKSQESKSGSSQEIIKHRKSQAWFNVAGKLAQNAAKHWTNS